MISPISNGELGSSVRAKINTAFDMLNEIPAPIAVGDILLGAGIDSNGINTWTALAGVATGNVLLSGGVGANPSYGKVGLTTHVSGILPVANGGSGTSTAFTTGSILFAGASGVYSQDNATLFWDDTNNFLGVGTATPKYGIDIRGPASPGFYHGLTLTNTSITMPNMTSVFAQGLIPTGLMSVASSATGGMAFSGISSNGTTNGFPFFFSGYHGSSGTNTTPALTFRGAKYDGGTNATALGSTEIVLEIRNWTTTNLMVVLGNGDTGLGVVPTAKLDVNSDKIRLRTAKTPASAGASGNAGDICWDASYVYVCTATNTWKRSAIATW